MDTKMTMLPPAAPPAGHYRSYLVRFWQSNEEGCWRASAQCVQTGSMLLFGDVESLLAFLQSELGDKPGEEGDMIRRRDKSRLADQSD